MNESSVIVMLPQDLASLAAQLEMSEFELSHFVFRADFLYKHFAVDKKSGGKRRISAPNRDLKRIQKWIVDNILRLLFLHEACIGYRVGKSILDNAKPHVGKDFVFNVDIENFFPTIEFERVAEMFHMLGTTPTMASYLARLCTFDDVLPQGAPTSPDIANLICFNLDVRLAEFCAARGWSFTRYCDDITISGNGDLTRHAIDAVRKIIETEGFKLNEKKMRVAKSYSRQTVTGLVVNEQINLPRRKRRLIRAMIHRTETKGVASSAELNKIHGHIALQKMIASASHKKDQ